MSGDLDRLSLNQITTKSWTLPEAVDGCARWGLGWIGLWRDQVAAVGLDEAVGLLRRAGLAVSSLCRGGFFPSTDAGERDARAADNRRAIDEAAALGARVLVMVCGGIAGGGLDRSRGMVAEGIAELAPYAGERGVTLAIEPLHPMFCADRSVIVTLAQALDLAEQFPAGQVGVVVDTFHVWWDPTVEEQIARAGGRIAAFQVCDWLDPLPDVLLGRGMMGDGPIDFRRLRRAVDRAGYRGPIEVEIFNADVWASPGGEVMARLVAAYRRHVLD